jgi:hypothetical protein
MSAAIRSRISSSPLTAKNIKVTIYRTIILPIVSYRCETRSLTFRNESMVKMFDNRVLRKMFGPKREKVTADWRK